MRKKLIVILWISLVVLVIAFCSLVIYQNKLTNEQLKEQERIEAEQEAAALAEAQEEDTETEEELPADEYTFTDLEATYFAQSDATVREEPYDTAEIIGTLSIDQRISVVGTCNETDYYKIKINGDYGYIAFDDVSEEYIDIPVPSANKAIPSATKDILFIGNSITFYPATSDWWGSGWVAAHQHLLLTMYI